jgi:hypothetical protein
VVQGYVPPMREDKVEIALPVRRLGPVLWELKAHVLDGVAKGALQDAQAELKVLRVGAPAPRELELGAVRPKVEQARIPKGSRRDGGASPVVHRRRELVLVPEQREFDAKDV